MWTAALWHPSLSVGTHVPYMYVGMYYACMYVMCAYFVKVLKCIVYGVLNCRILIGLREWKWNVYMHVYFVVYV